MSNSMEFNLNTIIYKLIIVWNIRMSNSMELNWNTILFKLIIVWNFRSFYTLN